MKYIKSILLLVMCSMCIAVPVRADNNDALLELLKVLHENGTINTETYELVKQVSQQNSPQQQVTRQTDREEIKQVVKDEVAEATKEQLKIVV